MSEVLVLVIRLNDIAYLFLYTVVSCGDPGSLVNGFRIGDKFTYEERVIYDCNAGYKLQGSIIRKCEANGHWSGSTASCVGEELQIISTIYTRFRKNIIYFTVFVKVGSQCVLVSLCLVYPIPLEFVNNDRSLRRILGVKPNKRDGLLRESG